MSDGLPEIVTVKDGIVVYAVAVCDDPRHQGTCELPCVACDSECDPQHRRAPGDPFYPGTPASDRQTRVRRSAN